MNIRKSVKAIIYTGILMAFVACEMPSFQFSNLRSAVIEEGDSLLVHLSGQAGLTPQTASNDSICKVVPTNKDKTKLIIYALRPGIDTVDIYGVSCTLAAHANLHRLYVRVIEKDTTQY